VLDASGYAVDLTSLLAEDAASVTVLVFFTHYADLSSWECAQQLVKAMPDLSAQVSRSPLMRAALLRGQCRGGSWTSCTTVCSAANAGYIIRITADTRHVQGVRLVAVGLGEPVQARQFCEILSFPVEMLYSDPSGAAYSALGFRCALRCLACPALVLPAVPVMLQ